MGRWGRRCKQLLDDLTETWILEIERGGTRSDSGELTLKDYIDLFKADYEMNEYNIHELLFDFLRYVGIYENIFFCNKSWSEQCKELGFDSWQE
jgi:hypothetical protein